jgi:cytochrome P450
MQAELPVFWSESIGAWIVTRYDDLLQTYRDVAHFSNEDRLSKVVDYLPDEQRANYQTLEGHFSAKGLLHSDPPHHTHLRKLVNKAFTPQVVENLRPRLQALVDELLDPLQGAGQADLVQALANQLPAIVIAEIFGAPPEDRFFFKDWADAILSFQGLNRPGEEVLRQAQDGLIAMRGYVSELIDERCQRPRDDLLSRLAAAEVDGEKLTEPELLSTCVTLMVAGHETTTGLIGSGLLTLLKHPEQLKRLRQDPSLMHGAIEEILRFESPLSRQPRRVRQEVELGGCRMREGEIVMQMIAAANRDPLQFHDPDRFDISRQSNRHLAFGMGIHYCVGAPLARLEGPIAIGSVLRRMPRLELANECADWDTSRPSARLLRSLPVVF